MLEEQAQQEQTRQHEMEEYLQKESEKLRE
jgi:hypothetical protein